MPIVFPFDPDLAKAATIPSRLYVDPVYHELERERIFARTWQLVARTEQLAQPGDYVVVEIAGESVVLVRDAQGLRGYHNVCLHRAGPVATGCGRRQTLQCKYHGWTYSLAGELLRAPEMESTEHFRPADFRLHPVQVASWGPLVFATLDLKAPPLLHFLEGIPARAASFRPEAMRWVMRKEYPVRCNWKVYVDNYLEGYHLPVVHPGLHKEPDWKQRSAFQVARDWNREGLSEAMRVLLDADCRLKGLRPGQSVPDTLETMVLQLSRLAKGLHSGVPRLGDAREPLLKL